MLCFVEYFRYNLLSQSDHTEREYVWKSVCVFVQAVVVLSGLSSTARASCLLFKLKVSSKYIFEDILES